MVVSASRHTGWRSVLPRTRYLRSHHGQTSISSRLCFSPSRISYPRAHTTASPFSSTFSSPFSSSALYSLAHTPASPARSSSSSSSAPILLRDYQEECIQSVLASLARGQRRLGISLATGAGKTVIFTQLLDRIKPTSPDADQTLILAHRRELVEQAARHCTRAYPHKTVEVEMGSIHASGVADITVASVQSLTSGQRMDKFDPLRFKLVLVDEAHHIVAPGYMKVLAHFGLDEKAEVAKADGQEGKAEQESSAAAAVDGPALVGVSATFSRFDGLALGKAIDEIVYHKDYVDMIGDGWLSDVVFTTVESTADLSRVRTSGGAGRGDFQQADLSKAVNTQQVNEITVRTWLAKAQSQGRQSTLAFCVDLRHVADLTATFRRHGVEAQFVTGETDKVERSKRLEAFKALEFPVLINCGVFTEGTDMPNVDCVILARPTKSRNLLVQMIGRGMRLHENKANCHVIDMVSSLETGVVTTPTLFGLDPSELVSSASVEDMQKLREERLQAEEERQGQVEAAENEEAGEERAAAPSSSQPPLTGTPISSVRFTDYESVYDLIADTSGEKHVRILSQHAWVQTGKERYVLSGPTGTYLRLERIEEDRDEEQDEDEAYMSAHWENYDEQADAANSPPVFRVVEVRALPPGLSKKSPYAAPREVCRAATLADAIHGADNYASKIFPRPFVYRYQGWRRGPPTKGQLEFVNKVRDKSQPPLTADDIDRGTASDMITKIKHGARGRFADLAAARRRRDREASVQAREAAQRQREHVAVGPLAA